LTTAGKLAWGLVLLAAILHYDFWNWTTTEVVFGFMPVGLAYQAGISLLAGLAWTLVIKFAWPGEVEEWANAGESEAKSESR
jgi:hypothetical protein